MARGYLAVSEWEVTGASQCRKGTLCSWMCTSYRPWGEMCDAPAACPGGGRGGGLRGAPPSASAAKPHLDEDVPHDLGGHEDQHDGEAVGHVAGGLHHDDRQAQRHPHDAACQGVSTCRTRGTPHPAHSVPRPFALQAALQNGVNTQPLYPQEPGAPTSGPRHSSRDSPSWAAAPIRAYLPGSAQICGEDGGGVSPPPQPAKSRPPRPQTQQGVPVCTGLTVCHGAASRDKVGNTPGGHVLLGNAPAGVPAVWGRAPPGIEAGGWSRGCGDHTFAEALHHRGTERAQQASMDEA